MSEKRLEDDEIKLLKYDYDALIKINQQTNNTKHEILGLKWLVYSNN